MPEWVDLSNIPDKRYICGFCGSDKTKPIGSKENPLLIENIDAIAKNINPIEKRLIYQIYMIYISYYYF